MSFICWKIEVNIFSQNQSFDSPEQFIYHLKNLSSPRAKVFLCGKLGKPASLQAIFSIFYGSEENTKTEDFFGRGGGGGG